MKIAVIYFIPFEKLGCLRFLLPSATQVDYYHYRDCHSEPLKNCQQVDLLVVCGGPLSVHQESLFPQIRLIRDLLHQRLNHDRATWGFCFGAQLLATALGAQVVKMPKKEIGFAPLTMACENFTLLPPKVLHWHGESISELPRYAETLASTAACQHQAFRYGNSLGVQFHPEFDVNDVEYWLLGHLEELLSHDIDILRLRVEAQEYHQHHHQVVAFWQEELRRLTPHLELPQN